MDFSSLFTIDNAVTLGSLAGAFLLGGTAAARSELRRVVREEVRAAVRDAFKKHLEKHHPGAELDQDDELGTEPHPAH